ncbi:MAG: hypothetical protein JO255_16020 [Alphaproteobacteria bacterium]|nr:hypothetical protein [Alphaproteobacteria bacterium]
MRLSRVTALAALALSIGATSSFAGSFATNTKAPTGVPGLTAPSGNANVTLSNPPNHPPNWLPCRQIFHPEGTNGYYQNSCTGAVTYLLQ